MTTYTGCTVSGCLGSGAREVAQLLARDLGWDYVDQEVLVEAARELGVSVSDVAQRDEPPTGIRERLASVMRTMMERTAAGVAADPVSGVALDVVLARTYGEAVQLPPASAGNLLDDQAYLTVLTSVMKGIAARGNVIILGRGGQAVLQDESAVFHLYVANTWQARVDALVEQDAMTPADADKRLKTSDHHRVAFHKHYFKRHPEDPALYHLMVHAGRLGIAGALQTTHAAMAPHPHPRG
ncbi:MAG: cytidylate kinase-like family protein [Chloroflexi bacterium]|nr:cytidylate kinase-like family protein [Chloroflexota bacterium]